jgi:hypothetical protein
VPANATLTLPVTCVEAGRWRHVSREFAPAERAMYASARRDKLGHVSRALASSSGRSKHADQSAVWSEIAEKSARMDARSETGAAAAIYERRRDSLDDIIASMTPAERQVGAIFTIRGEIAGLDAFDSPRTWTRAMPKLLRSYGLDSLDDAIGGGGATPAPEQFVRTVSALPCKVYPGVGQGQDLRFEGGGITGAALDTTGGIVHAVAFPVSDADPRSADSITSRRRQARQVDPA